MTNTRMAVVISHPIQHFAPMFRKLAKTPGLDLKVFHCCDWGTTAYRDPGFGKDIEWDVPLLDGYDSEFLPIARRPTALSFRQIDNPTVGARLDDFRPDAVWVHGYSHRTQWRVRRWCIRNRARMMFFGDSELLHKRPWRSRLLKRLVLPRFYRSIHGFITIGDNNEAYYRHYGVAADRFFRGAFPVDIGRFRQAVAGMTPEDRAAVRVRFGLAPGAMVVLFVGKFIGIKRPLDLVAAMQRLRGSQPLVQALMVGSGELESAVAARVQELALADSVRLAGFVNQAEMPRVLATGDVLAMCSEKDPHPLVVTEAMAVGMP